MASIQSYLDKIMKAIYGKEVRSSIHDAIKAIDEEVEETTSKVSSWEQNEIQRQSAENERQTNEQGRNVAENIRNTNENTRISKESSRAVAEDARVSAENARTASEADRAESESHRASKETERATAEGIRKSQEDERKANEASRQSAEEQRAENENARQAAEGDRSSQEAQRATAETIRAQNEEGRVLAESQRQSEFENMNSTISEKVAQVDQALAGQVVTDETLTHEGQAADAKAAGDRIKALEERPEPESIVVDGTLSNTGQAADAKVTGQRLGYLEHRVFDVKESCNLAFDEIEDVPFTLGTPFTVNKNGMFVLTFFYLGAKPTRPILIGFTDVRPAPEPVPISEDGSGPPPDESITLPLSACSILEHMQMGTITLPAIQGKEYTINVEPSNNALAMSLRLAPMRISITASV